MGKTVAIIVGAVAAIAITIAAPYLAGAFLSLIGTTTATALALSVTTALIGGALAIGLSLAMRALVGGSAGTPSARNQSAYSQGTAIVGQFGAKPRFPLERMMPALRVSGHRRLTHWSGFRRFHILELVGDCMAPGNVDRFAIVDLKADLRRGDYCSIDVRDFRTSFSASRDVTGFCKRFRGVNWQLGFIETECTNPPMTVHCGLRNVTRASRIRATAPTLRDARELLKRVKHNPAAFDSPIFADNECAPGSPARSQPRR